MEDIYSEKFVKKLFDEMSKTYGIVNLFSSLGFAYFWRRITVHSLPNDATAVADLMTGGAECLSHIQKRFKNAEKIHLIDWCEKMCERAQQSVNRSKDSKCRVFNSSALELPVPDQTYDAIISTFGLKTLSIDELNSLGIEIKRVLKPNGALSILEFSMPKNSFVRFFFRLYVKFYVPFLGWCFLANPDNYRMLWRYTKEFKSCEKMIKPLEDAGFFVRFNSYFFGSATQIIAIPCKPNRPSKKMALFLTCQL